MASNTGVLPSAAGRSFSAVTVESPSWGESETLNGLGWYAALITPSSTPKAEAITGATCPTWTPFSETVETKAFLSIGVANVLSKTSAEDAISVKDGGAATPLSIDTSLLVIS